MYSVAFEKEAEKEFLNLEKQGQLLVSSKVLELQQGNFAQVKPLKGKHKGKFRKRAGDYRIIYLKEKTFLVISVIRIAHRKEVYLK